ncbi:endolytic transglycosylase MltG [Wohlfahrtiimonas populi]|uniref:endolytic transglycosylase MltG n=1 Tax=Wohlfahrtiimonas populi TaxID=1940240 RepID=UPI001E560A3A|nr:endolytic transglycosylase MltG [Wohlfahrtiimonas populi]
MKLLNYLKKVLLFFVKYVLSRAILLVLFLGLFIGLAQFGYNFLNYMKSPMLATDKSILIDVKSGMNADSVLRALKSELPNTNTSFLKIYGRLTGTLSDIKVGEYEITETMRPTDFWAMVTKGRSVQYSFTIVDGWSFKQMREALAKSPNVVQTLSGNETPEEIMTLIGYEGQPYEGYFMPETYLFPRGYQDVEVLKRSYESMNSFVDEVWQNRDLDLPIQNKHELLTLASIIEKETGVAHERPEISGVFVRRLQKGMRQNKHELLTLASIIEKETGVAHERPEISGVFVRRLQKGMRLQTDPTVIYGLGDKYRGTIYRSDLQRDTPYNTYTRDGLPPTPIAMPSVAAVYAAANPKEGDSLYFVAKGDGSGEHVFNATLDGHNKSVREYRARLNNGK